ncbi:peptide/nickel transport system substrate-binding protein [Pelagirhabdus alkalitolerans]|uniref:Peptide/nickel transport system substrate-binding protein n=1 Tax=Pelagirhabdus alkalitolerans TaxID=1612202 RepID=A0A1G6KDF6_9BACI|nr:peptide/nickel transport system substrate-binding protein [Pelagirhabdus alkalitolerans]
MKKTHIAILFLFSSILILSACDQSTDEVSNVSVEHDYIDGFNQAIISDEPALDGGEITFGIVSDSPFQGVLNYNFYVNNRDRDIIDWFDEPLLALDANDTYTQDGAANYDVDHDDQSITLTIRDDVNWHDGNPVTAEDWAYAYEVIGHPDYEGPRYGADMRMIEGMEAYHSGESEEISGITIHDEKSLTIQYERLTPSLLANGIWPYALPKHVFEAYEVSEMASSEEVRQSPIGMGPFKVERVVPGESVLLTKNEDYWRGEPNLDQVTIKVIGTQVATEHLRSGEVDILNQFPTDQYVENQDLENITFLGDIDFTYTYIGFKLGEWDDESGQNVMHEDAKMGDVKLRRAMWYAVDHDQLGEELFDGLRWNATTLVPPTHPDYHDESIETPTYDPEQAEDLLDEAGYVDVTGDGFREDPDGEPLEINFASVAGGDTALPMAQYYVQSWQDIGLNVELAGGQLMDNNVLFDRLENDDPDIDVYVSAWAVGTDVNPEPLYGRYAPFNYSRYTSERQDELLEKGLSEEAFDMEYRQEVYSEWQAYMAEQVPVFPMHYRMQIVPVHDRVSNYAVHFNEDTGIHRYQLGVTEETD